MQNLKKKIKSLLIWSQKYTQTDMIYLAKGGAWLTLGKIASSVSAFLLGVAFANLLDPATYGNYKYVLSLVGILGIFSLTGMGTAITQAVARGLEGSFYKGFKTKLKWGLVGSLAAITGAIYYFVRGNYLLPIPLLISAIFLPLVNASKIYAGFLTGRKLFRDETKYSILSQVIPIGAIIATLFLTKNLFWLIAVYFVSHTILNFSLYLVTQRKFKPNKKEDPKTLSYGKHVSIMKGVGIITGNISNIFVFHFLGSQNLAIFSFALAPIEQIRGLLRPIEKLLLPRISRNQWKVFGLKIFLKKIAPALGFLTFGIIIYIFLAPIIYKLIFPKYLESITYSQIFSTSLIFTFLIIILLSILRAKQKTKQLYIMSSTDFFSSIFITIPMIYFFGIMGLIFALLSIKIIESILLMFFIFKKTSLI